MIRISLTDTDREQLIKLREGSISEHSEKTLMVILSDQGKSPVEIARHLQRNPHTVRDWLKRYKVRGIAGFRREYSPGRPATVRGTITEIIQEIIEDTPSNYGLHANSWTAQLVVDHLKTLDIHSSIDTVKRALKDLGYSYKRPSKAVPENAPTSSEKKEQVLDMIDQIRGIIHQGDCEIFALDESHFSTSPYLSRGWIKRGQKKLPSPTVRGKRTLFGALNLRTTRMYWKNAPTGNSKYFKLFLEQLKSNNPGKTLVIILDNASIHIAKSIRQYLRDNANIHLFFLPTYSPEYNPIERFWLWLKRKAYGFMSFVMIEDLLRVVRKIIWNYNEDRIEHGINFQMNI